MYVFFSTMTSDKGDNSYWKKMFVMLFFAYML